MTWLAMPQTSVISSARIGSPNRCTSIAPQSAAKPKPTTPETSAAANTASIVHTAPGIGATLVSSTM